MKKDVRATYKPSKRAQVLIEWILLEHPELDNSVSAAINYALEMLAPPETQDDDLLAASGNDSTESH